MKIFRFVLFSLLISCVANAQVTEKDTTKMGYVLKDTDTLSNEPIELPEIIVYKEHLDPEARKQFTLLQNRVYKVYPYAKIGAEKLSALNKGMNALKTGKEKKKYFKIAENYMENEFEAQLKKLSRKQGQILVKLIYRQTGQTTFQLIKDLKSGWKAFWSNNTAKLFDINIKEKYAPYEVNEDYLIETILVRAFNRGRLVKQEAANPVDYDELSDFWEKKANELKK
ncbi:hypothetical protein FNO01nite_17890 [Flavobacterium noncentrifugens]|uniref:DUF4294 domain-containing protein n=1 Tax=Flavobacterium noncentrifugens TaxID=1128970 RepID=A0A1G8X117_9FLAO|nr:DUF4294 domain-containing protein [Flavobacterium noncentrifugens]GEP51117.1 hypothetical protein FNO01nite_17890 [Flavobacterium noncentrifugens]SDJ84223.1 protein of unknown function [Flavobacterium noncentrifugens]